MPLLLRRPLLNLVACLVLIVIGSPASASPSTQPALMAPATTEAQALARRFEAEALENWNRIQVRNFNTRVSLVNDLSVLWSEPRNEPPLHMTLWQFDEPHLALVERHREGSAVPSASGYNPHYTFDAIPKKDGDGKQIVPPQYRLGEFNRRLPEVDHTNEPAIGIVLVSMHASTFDLRQLFDPQFASPDSTLSITGYSLAQRAGEQGPMLRIDMVLQYAGRELRLIPPCKASAIVDPQLQWSMVEWTEELPGGEQYREETKYRILPKGRIFAQSHRQIFYDFQGDISQDESFVVDAPVPNDLSLDDVRLERYGLSEADVPDFWQWLDKHGLLKRPED